MGAALVLPHANTHAMTLHPAEISRSIAPGAHAMLICDGAGWHRTGGRLRTNKLSNSVFDTYDTIHRRRRTDIVDRCCTAWTWLMDAPDRIRSLATTPWTKTVKAGGDWYKRS